MWHTMNSVKLILLCFVFFSFASSLDILCVCINLTWKLRCLEKITSNVHEHVDADGGCMDMLGTCVSTPSMVRSKC